MSSPAGRRNLREHEINPGRSITVKFSQSATNDFKIIQHETEVA